MRHDISNQLTIISGYADLMLVDEPLTDKQLKRLIAMIKCCYKIKGILDADRDKQGDQMLII